MTGAPVKPETIWTMMNQLRNKILKMLEEEVVKDVKEKEKLEYLIKMIWDKKLSYNSNFIIYSCFCFDYIRRKLPTTIFENVLSQQDNGTGGEIEGTIGDSSGTDGTTFTGGKDKN